MKVFGDDECLTTINILKEPIKGYQHYNISDNELDNKVDWQGTSHIPSDTAISVLARLYPACLQECVLSC